MKVNIKLIILIKLIYKMYYSANNENRNHKIVKSFQDCIWLRVKEILQPLLFLPYHLSRGHLVNFLYDNLLTEAHTEATRDPRWFKT